MWETQSRDQQDQSPPDHGVAVKRVFQWMAGSRLVSECFLRCVKISPTRFNHSAPPPQFFYKLLYLHRIKHGWFTRQEGKGGIEE